MVSSIVPPVPAHHVQVLGGYPTGRGAGIPGLHNGPANNDGATSLLDAIRQSAATAINNLGAPDSLIPRSDMIREFLGIERNGMPAANPAGDSDEGLCSAMSSTVREKFETALKSNGMICRNMRRPEMIKLTLGLGSYAGGRNDSELMSAAARITAFCSNLMREDGGRAVQAGTLLLHLGVAA